MTLKHCICSICNCVCPQYNIVFPEYDPIYATNNFPCSFKYDCICAKYDCIWPQYEEKKLSSFDSVGTKYDMYG